jgi:hypothetical protein
MSYMGALMAMAMYISSWCSIARVLDSVVLPDDFFQPFILEARSQVSCPGRLQVKISYLGLGVASNARFLGFGSLVTASASWAS